MSTSYFVLFVIQYVIIGTFKNHLFSFLKPYNYFHSFRCDLRGNPNFFPADADRKNRIKLDKTKKENNNKSNCVRC